jgi:hypothetical protein
MIKGDTEIPSDLRTYLSTNLECDTSDILKAETLLLSVLVGERNVDCYNLTVRDIGGDIQKFIG